MMINDSTQNSFTRMISIDRLRENIQQQQRLINNANLCRGILDALLDRIYIHTLGGGQFTANDDRSKMLLKQAKDMGIDIDLAKRIYSAYESEILVGNIEVFDKSIEANINLLIEQFQPDLFVLHSE